MQNKYSLFFSLTLYFFSINSCQNSKKETATLSTELVTIKQFQNFSAIEPNITIIDLQDSLDFVKEHLENAIHISRKEIENTELPYEGMMASKTKIRDLFRSKGIKSNDHIVLYDNKGNTNATRLFWILEVYGYKNSHILDGGITEWKRTKNTLTTVLANKERSDFNFNHAENTASHVSYADVKNSLSSANNILIDCRTHEEFSGAALKKGAFCAGNIPGSILLPHEEVMTKKLTMKSIPELTALFNNKGITKDKNIIIYCHSGVRSAHMLFVLTKLLGYKKVKNYDGSWIEWSYFLTKEST
jgi:thiosulfate/3-mercaptopyruvate sulfurtransferase